MDWKPDFSEQSPYSLKLSIALAHVVGNIPGTLHPKLFDAILGPEGGQCTNNTTSTNPHFYQLWMDSSILGGTWHACMPMALVVMGVVAAMMPGIVHGKGSGLVTRVMVHTLGFAVVCTHASMTMVKRVLGFDPIRHTREGVLLSVVLLHIAVHIINHTNAHVSSMSKRTRRGANHLFIVHPLMWGCMCMVHFLALVSTRRCHILSQQDIICVHAVMAFVPELLGTVYSRLVCILVAIAGPWVA